MRVALCDRTHSAAILDILNEAIRTSTALYDYHERTLESMHDWFEQKRAGSYPVIGAFDEDGKLLGFGSYGSFRARPAYKYTVEHSVYVERNFRGRGVGKRLLSELIASARRQDYHCLIGGIDAQNQASIGLHLQAGFVHCASIRQAGFKFNQWLDLELYQLLLETPSRPQDG